MNATAYQDQIKEMTKNGRQWLDANPGVKAEIQFNTAPDLPLVAAISDAVGTSLVSTNPAGLELLKSLWRWDIDSEPTVRMVRIVIENLERK